MRGTEAVFLPPVKKKRYSTITSAFVQRTGTNPMEFVFYGHLFFTSTFYGEFTNHVFRTTALGYYFN